MEARSSKSEVKEDTARPSTRYRLFVGIEAPDVVKERLEAAQRKLAEAVPPEAVRWVRREQFHLTLRFLGSVDVEQLEELQAMIEEGCRSFAVLTLRAEGVGFFPRPASPKVIWAGVQGDLAGLGELQRAIEKAVAPFTAEPGEDRFHAHLTLGRAKHMDRRDADELLAKAQGLSQEVFGEWKASEVQLMRSELSPKGARYTVIARTGLRA